METLSFLGPLFTAIIAFVAILTSLGFIINMLLVPVKENQEELKKSHKDTNKRLDDLSNRLENLSFQVLKDRFSKEGKNE